MLNVAVPYEVNTVHSHRYNYQTEQERLSPLPSQHTDAASPSRSRRGSAIIAEDAHCHTLAEPVASAPPVIVFFSFMNDTSRKWALDLQVVDTIRKNVPQGTTISRFHAPMQYSWDFGEDLTRAWAVAGSLHFDDKIIGPLFEAVHSKRVHDLAGIRTIFAECGVDPTTFSREWTKNEVLQVKSQMDEAVAHIDLQEVPGILVKGKFMVKLDSYGQDFSAEHAVELVKTLLARE